MSDLAPPASADQIKRFEELGEDHVRDLVQQWSPPLSHQGRTWLKAKRDERDQIEAALRADQAALARKTLRWAVIAGLTSCAAVLVSIGAWLFPRG